MKAGNINCSHTFSRHLLHNICCKNQTLLKKIANVVFNVLTLCIPLIVYNIYSYFHERSIQKIFHEKSIEIEKKLKEKMKEIEKRPIEKKYSEIGKEAIDFAKQKLLKHKELFFKDEKILFSQIKFKPKNEAIAYLTKIYFYYFEELCKALKKSKNDWNKEVETVADAYFKIGYAVTSLTLDDLKLLSEYSKKSYEECLIEQKNSYMWRTFFHGLTSYRSIRGKLAYYYEGYYEKEPGWYTTIENYENEKKWMVEHFDYSQGDIKCVSDCEHDKDPYSKKFFKEGTIQNKWRNLYNNLCKRIYQHVDKKKLKEKDSRFTNLSRQDLPENSEKFSIEIGSLPT